MEDLFKVFRGELKKILFDSISCELNIDFAMYENQDSFKRSVEELYYDMKALSKISESIFDKHVYPMLFKNKFGIDNSEYVDLKELFVTVPESRNILKELKLDLEYGKAIDFVGSIRPELEDLSKFTITLFANAVCYLMLDKEISSVRSLSANDLKKLKIGFIRVLVHELSHLKNYFTKSREKLLSDFAKQYSFSNFEREAFLNEFLYQFIHENGVDLIKNSDKDKFLSEVKKLRCWKTGLELDYFGSNVRLFNDFLSNIYDYFTKVNNDKLKEEKQIYEFPNEIFITAEDIRNINVTQEMLDSIVLPT